METTGALSGLGDCMAALATDVRVYTRCGRFTEAAPDMPELAAQIRGLLGEIFADPAWHRFFAPGRPMSVQDIGDCLEPVEVHAAAAFMAGLATVDIMWPSHRLMDHGEAVRAATRAVALLGPDATWWTNHDTGCGATNGITPAFDSVIAGTNGTCFAVAIQIADD